MPAQLLLRRILAARATERLRDALRSIKNAQNLGRDLVIGKTSDEVAAAALMAVEAGWLRIESLARLVDEIEENGGQHVFLFGLREGAAGRLTALRLRAQFDTMAEPTAGIYGDAPAREYWFFRETARALVLKKIGTASYWERDDERSFDNEDERAVYSVRRTRRAVNTLMIYPEAGLAEVRIDRIKDDQDDKLAATQFAQFADGLKPQLDLVELLVPTRIWVGFQATVRARDETFMTWDEAQDASVKRRISSRREDEAATDVRDHPDYRMLDDAYSRSVLSVYFLVGDRKIHAHLSRFRMGDVDYGKIYIGAKRPADEIAHVINRVRTFAG